MKPRDKETSETASASDGELDSSSEVGAAAATEMSERADALSVRICQQTDIANNVSTSLERRSTSSLPSSVSQLGGTSNSLQRNSAPLLGRSVRFAEEPAEACTKRKLATVYSFENAHGRTIAATAQPEYVDEELNGHTNGACNNEECSGTKSSRDYDGLDGEYPSFVEFGLCSDELRSLEEILHSGDESIGCLNYGRPTDPWSEVILLFETTSKSTVKIAYAICKLIVYLSVLSLIAIFIVQEVNPRLLLETRWYLWFNVAFAVPCSIVSLTVAVQFVWRLYRVHQLELTWSARRRRLSIENLVQVCAVSISNVFWVLPNIFLLTHWCNQPNDFVNYCAGIRWEARITTLCAFILRALDINFQTRRYPDGTTKDAMLLDTGWSVLPGMMVLWFVPSGFIVARVILAELQDEDGINTFCNPNSETWGSVCGFYGAQGAWVIFVMGIFVPLYFLLYMALVYRAYCYISARSYSKHRTANILLSLTFRQNFSTLLVTVLSIVCLMWIDFESCASKYVSWLTGMMPAELVMTGTIIIPAIIFMPDIPSPNTVQRYRIMGSSQMFAWLERDTGRTLTKMSMSLNDDLQVELKPLQHCFCFETAIKCLYWNWCVYLHSDEGGAADWGSMDILTAMSLYNLKGYQLVEEDSTHVKCLIGWNEDTILLSFRGTVSIRNCVQNVKIFSRVHLPKRKIRVGLLSYSPRVHHGFYTCWYGNQFNQRVLHAVQELCSQHGDTCGTGINVIVTGHSLGAALAMMAAWDLSVTTGFKFKSVRCYTFGCPHVGNLAFTKDYNAQVPDTWNIINDQDAVARSGKVATFFLRLFERPGNKVLVDGKGDMLVSPTALESYLQLVPAMASWEDHVLSSYDDVILRICQAQFTRKGFQGGLAGMLSILSHRKLRRYYASKRPGLDVYAELEQLRESESPRVFERGAPNAVMDTLRRLSRMV